MRWKQSLSTLAVFLFSLGTSTGCGSPAPASGAEPLPAEEGPNEPLPQPGDPPVKEEPGPVVQQPPPVKEEPGPVEEEPGPVEEEPGPVEEVIASPFLVKDVTPGLLAALPAARTEGYVPLGNRWFFSVDDGVHGKELWSTDGTREGTAMVTDLLPGAEGSNPESLVRMGDRLYFTARMLPGLYALWSSDGTAAGTRRVTLLGSHAQNVAVGDGVFIFKARAVAGSAWWSDWYSLWRSDGTPQGTWQLGEYGFSDRVTAIAPVWEGATLDFIVRQFDGGAQLWRTDGTAQGTHQVMGMSAPWEPTLMTRVGSRYVFWARGSETGPFTLWSTDGTQEGTVSLKSVRWSSSTEEQPMEPLTVIGDTVYFRGWDAEAGQEPWKTDGTPEGTVRIADLRPGAADSHPVFTATFAGSAWFTALEGTDTVLFKTDGTPEGTVRVTPPGARLDAEAKPQATPSGVFFSAFSTTGGNQVWRTDGTAGGTLPVSAADPRGLPWLAGWGGDRMFFTSAEGVLHATRGTPGTTDTLAPLTAGQAGSFDASSEVVDVDGTLFFTVPVPQGAGPSGRALWRSDGTAGGTQRVEHTSEHEPTHLTPLNGGLLFLDGRDHTSLWWLDRGGSESRRVGDLGGNGPRLVSTGKHVWFVRGQHPDLQELWRTDGTVEGTLRVVDRIGRGIYSDIPPVLRAVGDTLYFTTVQDVWTPMNDTLWKSDGTREGTVRVHSFVNTIGWDSIRNIWPAGSRVYFHLMGDPWTHQVWVTEGTPETTRFVAELPFSSVPGSESAVLGDTLFLSLGANVPKLWKTDGQSSGVVREFSKGPTTGGPTSLIAQNGQLLFWASDGSNGYALWKSDGTTAGTTPVESAPPPDAAVRVTSPSPLVSLRPGGPLLFTASDSDAGLELWRTDGTARGTKRLVDRVPGTRSSAPAHLTVAGDHLFFSAWTPESGRELWALPRQAPEAPASR
ncbi:ELWxxDGT repeat protein [Corallococcus exiguus]|uniref:ELWxxDGT repeat protein n=1 Tax=Corallococcus exiguus TaxID=83462 RepID=UPI003DA3301D